MNDIVYFVKEADVNEELVYSLRSVEQNFPHKAVWIYGGLPKSIRRPDRYVRCNQVGTKWERVRNMLRKVCDNDEISEDFWLFNDDFFILNKIKQPENHFDKTLEDLVEGIERRHRGGSPYTDNIRTLAILLKNEGFETKNYAIHVPMLINRKKMAEVLDKYPHIPMFRALYGNYWKIGGTQHDDVKVRTYIPLDCYHYDMISSSDSTWMRFVGAYIRNKFPNPSRFEG